MAVVNKMCLSVFRIRKNIKFFLYNYPAGQLVAKNTVISTKTFLDFSCRIMARKASHIQLYNTVKVNKCSLSFMLVYSLAKLLKKIYFLKPTTYILANENVFNVIRVMR